MKETNIQNDFLNRLKDERRPVSVIITNGYHIDGLITGHDQYSIQMDVDGQQQLVYKHAVSPSSGEQKNALSGVAAPDRAKDEPRKIYQSQPYYT